MSDKPVIHWSVPGAHALLHKLALARLDGKVMSTKRPSLIFRLPDGDFVSVVQPRLVSSPTGWRLMEVLPIRVESDRPGVLCELAPDDTVSLRRWWKNPVRNDSEIEILHQTLIRFVENPLLALRMGSGWCAICGRRLSDAESVSRGVGPECWGYVASACSDWMEHGEEKEVRP